jgi:hypothetical protein
MTDYDVLMYPEYWRDRAEKTLAMARNLSDGTARERLLRVAKFYKRLAVRAEDWKVPPEP